MFPIDPKAPLMGRESERAANGDPICRRCDQPASRHALGVRRVCPIFPTFSSAPAPAGDAATEAERLRAEVKQAHEREDAVRRYLSANPPKHDAIMAVLTEMSLASERRLTSASSPQTERQNDG